MVRLKKVKSIVYELESNSVSCEAVGGAHRVEKFTKKKSRIKHVHVVRLTSTAEQNFKMCV